VNHHPDVVESEISTSPAILSTLHSKEIDIQISTAHKFPRSISQFRKDVYDMVAVSEAVAAECMYALPRDGKMIEGPSARFAEILASAWGNSRAGARVVDEGPEFITAQGVFHDLQKNVAITYEVQRRITGKGGKRYNSDMIAMTGNAASSIALRNAILKGIPKAFWAEMFEQARRVSLGDAKTLPTRRAEAFAALQKFGITKQQACTKLGARGEEDIGLEQLAVLRGILTAIREGDTTAEEAFAPDDKPNAPMPTRASANATERDKGQGYQPPPPGTKETSVSVAPNAATQGQPADNAVGGETAIPAASAPVVAAPTVPIEEGGLSPEEAARFDAEQTTSEPPTGEIASPGEVANIRRRAEAAGITLSNLFSTMGMARLISNANLMTKEEFRLLKVKLS
jgi:hypothetical protein